MNDKEFDSALGESDNTREGTTKQSQYKVNRSTYGGTSRASASRGATETEFIPG